MIKLFGHPHSSNARKVHWALEELALRYEYETVDLMTGAQKRADFLQLNPNGRVPVLHDGDVGLFESNAILLYLADRYGAGRLLPVEPAARAQVFQWVSWQASDLAAALQEPWFMKFLATLGQPLDAARHASLVAAAAKPLEILNGQLQGRSNLVGSDLTVADIAAAESVELADFAGIDLAPYGGVRAWYAALTRRGAFTTTRPK